MFYDCTAHLSIYLSSELRLQSEGSPAWLAGKGPGFRAALHPLFFFFFFFLFVVVSLGKTLQSPSLVLVKPRKDMNNVSFGRDMTEIMLKAE